MKKVKSYCLIISIICFTVAGFRIIYNLIKDSDKTEINNTKVNYEKQVETISKLDKIGINTNFVLIDKYCVCNHNIEEKINIDKTLINKQYNDILEIYPQYNIITFNQYEVKLEKNINEYCPYHYILKEENNRINVYRQIDETTEDLIEILDIDIGTLRQADRYMFKTTGIKVYGQNELYQLIEDFNS